MLFILFQSRLFFMLPFDDFYCSLGVIYLSLSALENIITIDHQAARNPTKLFCCKYHSNIVFISSNIISICNKILSQPIVILAKIQQFSLMSTYKN